MVADKGLIAIAIAVLLIAAGYLLINNYVEESGLTTVNFSKAVPCAPKPSDDKRPELRIAVSAMVSPDETRKQYDELLQFVGDKLGMKVVFVQRRTYAEVNKLVEDKDVDAAFVCSGPYASGHDQFGMEIIAVPVVHGEKVYYSYIIVNAKSKYSSFSELRGKSFAFTDPDSNTGCLVPRYILAKMGETPESFFSDTFYTHSHDSSIEAVSEGKVDGASVDSLIWEYLNKKHPEKTLNTRVIAKSPPYGIPPIVVNPGLDPVLKKRLQQVLLHLHEDAEGKVLLKRLNIDRFEYADDHAYDEVRRMQRWLSKQGG